MASSSNRRWLVIGVLVTFGLVLAAVWPGGASEEGSDSDGGDSDTAAAAATDPSPHILRAIQPDGGAIGRRITPACKPIEESLKYEEFIGGRALAILSWNGMSEPAADLEIPVQVVGVEDGSVGVRFHDFPMRAQYVAIWLRTGHISAAPEGVFLLDPCSATLVAWSERTETSAADDYEDVEEESPLDERDDLENEYGDEAEEEKARPPWPGNIENPADFRQ